MMAEHERQKAEAELKELAGGLRSWLRMGFAEIVAVLALVAALVAWWH